MINNTVIAEYADVEKISAEIWDKTIATNLAGAMWDTKLGIEAMKNNGEKNLIINISSVKGLIGDPDLFAYNASKGGVRLLAKSVALNCARRGYDTRVDTIHPGYVSTPLVDNLVRDDPKAEGHLEGLHPLGRLGKPEEIVSLALCLTPDESIFSTGLEFVADGGYTAQ